MSRINEAFNRARESGSHALMPYLTAGFPVLNQTTRILHALVEGGADIIELGVPFSDPVADGPTIQRASSRALQNGTTVSGVLQMVRDFRKTNRHTPIILFGAFNPFLNYGLEKLVADAAEAGADGFLIPDVPLEENDEIVPLLKAKGLDLIPLVAPTSTPDRQRRICENASGFIYYISIKGVTGARSDISFELGGVMNQLRECTSLPLAVGFGISTPKQAAEVATCADGIVVGSALIDLIQKNESNPEIFRLITDYMRSLKNAISGTPNAATA
jgi:tryptophan synthase alpha chain